MCHQIYIATKDPIAPESQKDSDLQITLLSENHPHWQGLRPKFSLANIYYIASSKGCSCTLHVALYEGGATHVNLPAEGHESFADLNSFYALLILEACKSGLEIFSCWDGEEGKPIGESMTFDAMSLSFDNAFLPTKEQRFFAVPQIVPSGTAAGPVHFMNVDLDIEAPEYPQILLDYFEDKWAILVHPDDAGAPFIRYELMEQYADAETAILQFCAAIENLPKEVSDFWTSCPIRCLDIGYESGNERPMLVNSFSAGTLALVAKYFTELKVSIYPLV